MATQFLRYRPACSADCTPRAADNKDPAATGPITCERQASLCTDKELEILEAMFPRLEEWDRETGCRSSRGVSDDPATREDVVRVAEALDQQIKAYNLSSGRICRGREALVLDAFNEIIRQLFLDNPETGLLALRLRNERLMTSATYMELRWMQLELSDENEKGLKALEERELFLGDQIAELRNRKAALNVRLKTFEANSKHAQRYLDTVRREELRELREQGPILRRLIAAQDDKSFACSVRSRKDSITDEMRTTIAEVLHRMRM